MAAPIAGHAPPGFPPKPDFTPIKLADPVGALSLKVTESYRPQNVRGIVWKYELDAARAEWVNGVRVGEFTNAFPRLPIGGPSSAMDHLFLVVGTVLQQGDDPPTRYRVVATVSQGAIDLNQEVPADNGSGMIGKANVTFIYRFVVMA